MDVFILVGDGNAEFAKLVSARPKKQRGVVSAALHRGGCGIADLFKKFGALGGNVVDHRAGLDEILPNKNAVSVAKIIEALGFDDAAAPNAYEVHVFVFQRAHAPIVGFVRNVAVKMVERHLVVALEENALAVDHGGVGQRVFGRAGVLRIA